MNKRILYSLFLVSLVIILSSCGGAKESKNADLSAVMSEIENNIALDSSMNDISMTDLDALYGISSSDIVQFSGKFTAIGILADEVFMAEAAQGKVDAVRQKVEARYQSKLNEMRDYIPEEFEKIEACKVTTTGNYVLMFISSEADKMQELFTSAYK